MASLPSHGGSAHPALLEAAPGAAFRYAPADTARVTIVDAAAELFARRKARTIELILCEPERA